MGDLHNGHLEGTLRRVLDQQRQELREVGELKRRGARNLTALEAKEREILSGIETNEAMLERSGTSEKEGE